MRKRTHTAERGGQETPELNWPDTDTVSYPYVSLDDLNKVPSQQQLGQGEMEEATATGPWETQVVGLHCRMGKLLEVLRDVLCYNKWEKRGTGWS